MRELCSELLGQDTSGKATIKSERLTQRYFVVILDVLRIIKTWKFLQERGGTGLVPASVTYTAPFYPLSLILYPFALILFKHETRARLFAFFPLSALIIPPCLNAPSPQV